jgi:hypothetical protein
MAMVVSKEYCDPVERVLTVRKTSHFSPGNGFAAYDHRTGCLAFRADNYGPAGEPLLIVRRRRLSLHQRWEGFLGTRADGQKPLFSARRSSVLDGAVIELLAPPVPSATVAPPVLLRVDGSFLRRCCRVVLAARGDEEKEKVVAEIGRKVNVGPRVVMGRDVFVLRVSPGFDAAFAMGIVLVLDQIAGDQTFRVEATSQCFFFLFVFICLESRD